MHPHRLVDGRGVNGTHFKAIGARGCDGLQFNAGVPAAIGTRNNMFDFSAVMSVARARIQGSGDRLIGSRLIIQIDGGHFKCQRRPRLVHARQPGEINVRERVIHDQRR